MQHAKDMAVGFENLDEAWLRRQVRDLVEHVRRSHPDDPRTAAISSKVRSVRALDPSETRSTPAPDTWHSGKFKHSTGELFVALADNRGAPRTASSVRKTIVHELAHATRHKEPGETSHSQEWKQTWLWLLNVATAELGWGVDVRCAECSYYGLCETHQCPKCQWMLNLCKPYVENALP